MRHTVQARASGRYQRRRYAMIVTAEACTEFGRVIRKAILISGKTLVTIQPSRSISEIDASIISWGLDIEVSRFLANEYKGQTDVPMYLVEITEFCPPDAVVYYSFCLDALPSDADQVLLVERRSSLKCGDRVAP